MRRTAPFRSSLMRALLLGALLLTASATPLLAQIAGDPPSPAGAQDTLRFLDAGFISGSRSLASPTTPAASRLNPAVGALAEDLIIGGSYVGAVSADWPESGHGVLVGATIPTRFATFSGTSSFLGLNTDALRLGSSFSTQLSISKALGPNFTAGTGLELAVGGGNGSFDVGVVTSYGVYHRIPNVGPLPDLSWGLSMTGVGIPYNPVAGAGGVPAPFTPRGELAATLIEGEALGLDVGLGLSVPGLSKVGLDLGVEVSLASRIRGYLGSSLLFGAPRGANGSRRRGAFGGGLSIRYGRRAEDTPGGEETGQAPPRTDFAISRLYDSWLGGTSFHTGLGTVDTQPPGVSLTLQGPAVFSPNGDGTLDDATFGVEINENRFLAAYELRIETEEGELVRHIRSVDNASPGTGRGNRWDGTLWQRLVRVESGISPPSAIRWDGRDEEGRVVPDGSYTARLSARDTRGNAAVSNATSLRVDNTAPSAEIEAAVAASRGDLELPSPDVAADGADGADGAEELVFSPNGDGNQDVVVISQTTSSESQWFGTIRSAADTILRSWIWSDQPPSVLIWDGTDDAGERVPDGRYRYELRSEDAGGNRISRSTRELTKNSIATPIDIAIERSSFSPNGDGSADYLRLYPEVTVRDGIRSWRISIHPVSSTPRPEADDIGEEGFVFAEDSGAPPAKLDFAGLDAAGVPLPDGSYRARFTTVYRNGNRPEELSPSFVIDTRAPQAAVRADNPVFSPDGDGRRESVTLFHEASNAVSWLGEIRNAEGELVRRFQWRRTPDPTVSWDGTTLEGRLADDGSYRYTLIGVDAAENSVRSEPVEVILDTGETGVALSAAEKAFSPNADGIRDRLTLFPRVRRPEAVASYRALVVPEASGAEGEAAPIQEFSADSVPEELSWDGFDRQGRRAPDGRYAVRLSVEYRNGSVEEAALRDIVLDTEAPEIRLDSAYTLFSPNGDGRRDSVTIRQEGSTETLWEASILKMESDGTAESSGSQEVVRSYFWKGAPQNLTWNGRDDAGNLVETGFYRYRVSAQDQAGNRTVRELTNLRVDNRETELFVTVNPEAISPNSDSYRDQTRIRSYASLLDGAERWELTLQDRTGTVRRSYSGSSLEAEWEIVWDGRDDEGSLVQGTVTPVLTVWYRKGDRPRVEGPAIRVDTEAPQLAVELEPLPFSPDNDGVADELNIRLSVSDDSDIARWRFRILDRTGRYFNQFSGEGMPPDTLTWNGRASDGELVISAEDYPYVFEVRDALGNTAVTEGRIPIDILVVRDGDRLKVQIADITFAPNSAELITDQFTERGAKNTAIVNRLAEVFQKYRSYDIRIEGHAVNVSGTQREEEEELGPLSRQRAESVRQALVNAGVSARRLSVEGRGGTEPVVPHSDLESRWKNRRVEFVLIR